jgi:hypothetical protein
MRTRILLDLLNVALYLNLIALSTTHFEYNHLPWFKIFSKWM